MALSTRSRNFNAQIVNMKIIRTKNDLQTHGVYLFNGDAEMLYPEWEKPSIIISDGAYGVLGFKGDTVSHDGLAEWYEPHIYEWSKYAAPGTTLWFWNTEVGFAMVHPLLEK